MWVMLSQLHKCLIGWLQNEDSGRRTDQGIIVESTSYWASPVVPVLKPNRSIRACIDYRRLNVVTNKLEYYMPILEDVLEKVGPCKIVFKLDMSQGFHQIEVDQGSRNYTRFVTQYGHIGIEECPLDAFWSI